MSSIHTIDYVYLDTPRVFKHENLSVLVLLHVCDFVFVVLVVEVLAVVGTFPSVSQFLPIFA